MQPSESMEDVGSSAEKPQLSLFLTLFLLLVVTVVRLEPVISSFTPIDSFQLVALNAEWMIDSIDSLSPAISKEWIALILLPTVGSLAGQLYCSLYSRCHTNETVYL